MSGEKEGHEHGGHRGRLIEKMKTDSLCEHEYLEALLFNAIPRRNTNDIAHRLLAEFGNAYNIFNAPIERLMRVEGVGQSVASYLFCIGKAIQAYEKTKKREEGYPAVFEREDFSNFLRREYGDIAYELLDVYMLDKNSRIIMCKRFSSKEVGHVNLIPEDLMKSIIQEDATGIVLVHNHPAGNCQPSKEDERATIKMQTFCTLQNVLLCDHFIYGQDGVYSYFQSGELAKISRRITKQLEE